MAIQSLLPFCPLQNPANTEYGISLLGTAGLYALSGVLLGSGAPLRCRPICGCLYVGH